jgi:hypothetical protein
MNPLLALNQNDVSLINSGIGTQGGMLNGGAAASMQQSPLLGDIAAVLGAL